MAQKRKTPKAVPRLTIDGHIYELTTGCKTKKRAKQVAEEYRSEGRSVRVMKAGITSTYPWSVYTRVGHHKRSEEFDPKTLWWKPVWVND